MLACELEAELLWPPATVAMLAEARFLKPPPMNAYVADWAIAFSRPPAMAEDQAEFEMMFNAPPLMVE